MYLHLTLLATIIAAAFNPLVGWHEATRTTTLASSLYVESQTSEDGVAAPNPCYLDVVECPWKKTMRITEYGATGNLTASGKVPRVGMVATSDRSIPFGSKVEIEGRTYSVEDRTNKRIENTIDIFSENPRGLSYKVVYFK